MQRSKLKYKLHKVAKYTRNTAIVKKEPRTEKLLHITTFYEETLLFQIAQTMREGNV